MSKSCRIVLVAIMVLTVIGCKAGGPVFRFEQLDSNEAIVYVYRADELKGSGAGIDINIDGEFLGNLKSNGYLFKKISPGEHTIGCRKYCLGTQGFIAVPMQAYYFTTDYIIKGALLGKVKIEQIHTEVASATIIHCKYSSDLPRDYVPPLYPVPD